MTMRVVTPADGSGSVTFPAPDAYGTPTTLMAGTVLDVIPGALGSTIVRHPVMWLLFVSPHAYAGRDGDLQESC